MHTTCERQQSVKSEKISLKVRNIIHKSQEIVFLFLFPTSFIDKIERYNNEKEFNEKL